MHTATPMNPTTAIHTHPKVNPNPIKNQKVDMIIGIPEFFGI